MEHPHFIIAFTGNEQTGKDFLFRKLTAAKGFINLPQIPAMSCPHGKFRYDSRCYRAVDLPCIRSINAPSEAACITAEYICSGIPDAITVVGHALQLEELLRLLKEILSLGPVRDASIPVVLCINCCDEAERLGVKIDFSLLHDVLQIPVVPLHGYGREQMDDLKAALHYCLQPHHRNDFLYDCLDFSPRRLACECVQANKGGTDNCIAGSHQDTGNAGKNSRLLKKTAGRPPTHPLAGLLAGLLALPLLLWLTFRLSGRLTDLLWPVFFGAEYNLAAWFDWAGLPSWFTGSIIHGGFRAACCTILVILPPLFFFFQLLELLAMTGYFPWAALLSGLLTQYFNGSITGVNSDGRRGIFTAVCSTAGRILPMLNRAAAAAVPAGILIWILGNTAYAGPETQSFIYLSAGHSEVSLLEEIIRYMETPARYIGLDGTILSAFILGIPAHGLTIPAAMTAYLKTGPVPCFQSTSVLRTILTEHGWTWRTALCTAIIALTRFPGFLTTRSFSGPASPCGRLTAKRLLISVLGAALCAAIVLAGNSAG